MSRGSEPVESPDETTVFPYHDLTPPSRSEIYRARERISPYLPETPLVRSEWLSAELDADVYLKREDTLPTGAFKVRGGVNLGASLDDGVSQRGLVAASTGNHGQSVAYAGREFGLPVTICVPAGATQSKVASMETLGARVVSRGEDYDEARAHAERLAIEDGYRYVHSGNESPLVAGVATAGLEIVDELPAVDVVFAPVGGGSCAAGLCLTVGDVLGADVVGVQSAGAPAAYRAWKDGHLEPHDRAETVAEGLATRVPFALTQKILGEKLSEFLLVEDERTMAALRRAVVEEGILMEGACATVLAAALEHRELVAGQTVVLPITGRNLAAEKLAALLRNVDGEDSKASTSQVRS